MTIEVSRVLGRTGVRCQTKGPAAGPTSPGEESLALPSEEPLDDRERLVQRGLNVLRSADFLAAYL